MSLAHDPMANLFSKPTKASENSALIYFGIVCTFSITSGMLFEIILDLILDHEYYVNDLFERSGLLLILLVPGVMIAIANDRPNFAYLFCCWHTVQKIGCSVPVLSLCSKLVPSHFNNTSLLWSYLFWTVAGVASLFGFGCSLYSWPNILALVSGACSLCILFRNIFTWLLSIYLDKFKDHNQSFNISKAFSETSTEEKSCFIYLCCLLSTNVIVPCVVGGIRLFRWEYLRRADVCLLVYCIAALSFLPSFIPGRMLRFSAKLRLHKIKISHEIIRYISHEIRTPLNVIKNGVDELYQLMREIPQKNDALSILTDLQDSTEHATIIADDLLWIEKMEAEKSLVNLQLQPLDVFLQISKNYSDTVRRRSIAFSIAESFQQVNTMGCAELNIDSDKIKLVCKNIVAYMEKCTPTEEVLSISLRIEQCRHSRKSGSHFENENDRNQILQTHKKYCGFTWPTCFYKLSANQDLPGILPISENSNKHAKRSSSDRFSIHGQGKNCRGKLLFEVKSSGIGFAAIHIGEILGTSSRFDGTLLRGGGGSGLDLLICKEIIRQHRGKITFESNATNGASIVVALDVFFKDSKLQKGSNQNALSQVSDNVLKLKETPRETKQVGKNTFRHRVHPDFSNLELNMLTGPDDIHVPETPGTAMQMFQPTSPFRTTLKASTYLSYDEDEKSSDDFVFIVNLRVLVVDDIATNRKIIMRMLSTFQKEAGVPPPCILNVEVCEADDGSTALTCMEKSSDPFDIVFMDNIMSEMNGPQAAEAMRKNKFSGLIIGVTGNILDDDVSDFVAHGADSVLAKPVSKDKLKQIVGKILAEKMAQIHSNVEPKFS